MVSFLPKLKKENSVPSTATPANNTSVTQTSNPQVAPADGAVANTPSVPKEKKSFFKKKKKEEAPAPNLDEFNANHGQKPVVLIGGMNGRGKTTFLEAVLLGLYGANSFAYTESKYKTYGQYLRAYVNKSDGSFTTYVEIEFSMDNTEEEVYFVHREWDAKGQRVREKISVKKNGTENTFLTENWPMFVENILPSALSNFFFFDGEKIAELAVENTGQKMKESIKALLGISVLDLLDNDLGRIITKLSNKDTKDFLYQSDFRPVVQNIVQSSGRKIITVYKYISGVFGFNGFIRLPGFCSACFHINYNPFKSITLVFKIQKCRF